MLETKLRGPLTIALAVIGASLAAAIAGVLVLSHLVNAEAQEISAKRAEAVRASNINPRIAELEGQQAQAAGYDRIFSLLLPKQDQLLEVPRVIEQLGRAHSVEANFTFQGSPALDVTTATPLPFSLSATGRADNLAAYLRNLEVTNPRYLVQVDMAEITGTPLAPESSLLSIRGSFYYKP